jgi:DNA-binding MarR family transcriptional regulator
MTTSPIGIDESPAQRIAGGIARLGEVARARFWREGPLADAKATDAKATENRALGLNPTQARILLHLGRHRFGLNRLADLAAELGITAPTASDSVAALIAKGLIAKRPVPGDGRAIDLTLTVAGGEVGQALGARPDDLAAAAAHLSEAEQATLLRLLVLLIRDLQARGAIPIARTCVNCRYFQPYSHGNAARPHHCAFVDASFGDGGLRLDCADYSAAFPSEEDALWQRFSRGSNDSSPPPSI